MHNFLFTQMRPRVEKVEVLVWIKSSGIREEKTPCLRLAPQRERALVSAENDM